MELTDLQVKFLMDISRNKTECTSKLGRRIYNTTSSCYITRDKFLSEGWIKMDVIDKRDCPFLTEKGKAKLNEVYEAKNGTRL